MAELRLVGAGTAASPGAGEGCAWGAGEGPWAGEVGGAEGADVADCWDGEERAGEGWAWE